MSLCQPTVMILGTFIFYVLTLVRFKSSAHGRLDYHAVLDLWLGQAARPVSSLKPEMMPCGNSLALSE